METILELTYQRCKARAAANGLLDCAVTEGRNLGPTEQIAFDALLSRVHQFDAAIEQRAALRTA